jgi:hypothetical protein
MQGSTKAGRVALHGNSRKVARGRSISVIPFPKCKTA